jgi:hypothetical protein
MLKKFTFIFALLASYNASAAKYDALNVGDYDLDSGVYIQLVKASTSDEAGRGIIDSISKSGNYVPNINMYIYNPKVNTGRYLLDKNYGEVTDYLFETAYENGSFSYFTTSRKVLNNSNINKRVVNPNILIETYYSKTKTYTVWKANKLASGAKVLFSYQMPSQWHLDSKNEVIRLVSATSVNQQPQLKITNFTW